MKILLELPENEKNELKAFYQEKLNKLKEDCDRINKILSAFDMTYTNTGVNSENVEIVKLANGYIPKWTWARKIKFIIDTKGKPLTANQITDVIISDYEIDLAVNRKKVFSTVSGQLSAAIKLGKTFKRQKNEIDEYEYDLL